MTQFLQMDAAALADAGALSTAREIAQQPTTLAQTVALLEARAANVRAFLAPLLARPDLRIILTGAGSSAFIGESLAPILLRHLARRVEAIPTTDLLSGPAFYLQPDVPTLVVSFGRSGDSPESVGAVRLADAIVRDCHHLVFTCNERGALHAYCRDQPRAYSFLLPPATHDDSFAMTSSFTAMLLAGWGTCGASVDFPLAAARLSRTFEAILSERLPTFAALAAQPFERVVYLGSNAFQGIARESALKLLEMTDGDVVAMSDSTLGFRHGPKAIVTSGTLLFVLLSNDAYTRRYDLDLLRELRTDARAARIVAVSAATSDDATLGDCVQLPVDASCSDAELMFAHLLCGQLYAFHRALALRHKPDDPSRSGTMSRVVRGVTVHPF